MELWKQIGIATFSVILAGLLGWAGHIQTRIEEVDANIVTKEVIDYRSKVYSDRINALEARVIRLENGVYLLRKQHE